MTLTMEEKLTNAIAACEDTYEDSSKSNETSSLQFISSSSDKENGFKANLYKNTVTGKYVVCFCGSNDKQDWYGSDLQMAKNEIPDQLENAKDFIDNIKDEKGNKISISDIEIITGHSLGGSLAQFIGQMEQYKHIDVITLNAYGTNNMQESLMDKYKLSGDYTNINNFIIEGDVVANSSKHIGNVYEIPPLFLQNIYKKIGFSLCLVPSLAIPAFIKSEIIAHNGILDNSQNLFITATETAPVRRDPLLVDLDGDGIETTTTENGVFFDHQNDGFAETSAWVGEDDGILAFDKNNNGTIDNGTEIFGDSFTKADGTMAANGFEALAEFDTNNDGVINAQDTDFANLKILKGDGTLLTLEQAGIEEISLTNTETNTTDDNGNSQSHIGSFTKTDGTTGQIGDYLLQNNKMNSIATDWVEVSSEIEALPDISGSGTLYSLHQAMARDTSGALKTLIQSFISSPNPDSKMQIAKQIIFRWTGVYDVAEDSRGANINAKELAA